MIFSLLTIGFISILGQVLILRELNVAFYGVELIYILAIGFWLLWTATGALIGRRDYTPTTAVVSYLFFAFALLLPLDIVFIRHVRILFGGIPGSYLPFGWQLVAMATALCPVGLLLGLLFQWAAKLFVGTQRTLAIAYAIESGGGLLGGLVSTALLVAGIQNVAAIILCSLAALVAGLVPVRKIRSFAGSLASVVGVALIVALQQSGRLDDWMTRATHPDLLDTRDSPYGRITITRQADQFAVFENDALAFETQSTIAEELVHLAAIQCTHLQDVLILGGGMEGLLLEVLKHSPNKVDYVELNPSLLALTRRYLPDGHRAALESSAVTVHTTDPRLFVRDSAGYDLILIGMPQPVSGESNRFYTREFFQACANILRPAGVLAFRLQSSENIWTRFVTYRNASIHRALKDVFGDIVILPGTSNLVFAANCNLQRDPVMLAETFIKQRVPTRLVSLKYIRYLYTNDRFFDIAAQLAASPVAANTDTHPVCYRYSSMIWLSKFIPSMTNWDLGFFDLSPRQRIGWYSVLLACVCGLFLWIRRLDTLRRASLVAVAGFSGMVIETVLILHYQVTTGVLFQNIGILLMVFMGGLTAGSWLVQRAAQSQTSEHRTIGRKTGYSLMLGFAALGLLFAASLNLRISGSLAGVSVLMFAAGFLVSGVLAYTSLSGVNRQVKVVSPLYAADLLGGCAGSLLGSLLLIPFLGMVEAALLTALLALAGMLLVK